MHKAPTPFSFKVRARTFGRGAIYSDHLIAANTGLNMVKPCWRVSLLGARTPERNAGERVPRGSGSAPRSTASTRG